MWKANGKTTLVLFLLENLFFQNKQQMEEFKERRG